MESETVDFSLCRKAEKEVVEGLCLSYDILRGLCTESSKPCEAWGDLAGETEA